MMMAPVVASVFGGPSLSLPEILFSFQTRRFAILMPSGHKIVRKLALFLGELGLLSKIKGGKLGGKGLWK